MYSHYDRGLCIPNTHKPIDTRMVPVEQSSNSKLFIMLDVLLINETILVFVQLRL